MFNEKDLQFIRQRGSDPEKVKLQIRQFEEGFPYAKLISPASPGNGMLSYTESEIKYFEDIFNEESAHYKLLKFVPASGAASRMFSHLFAFRDVLNEGGQSLAELRKSKQHALAFDFFDQIRQMAFFDELKQIMEKGGFSLEDALQKEDYSVILDFLLTDKGLSYAYLPKAMLSFHQHPNGPRKAIEEHFVEGALYCNAGKEVHIHFTLSPEHISMFDTVCQNVIHEYEKSHDVKFTIEHSIQHAATDTIAVDSNNQPFRDASGNLLFRPGGHGALIANLSEQDADIIFIKNIDNIVPDRLKEETVRFKKVIGGTLIELQSLCFQYLELLDAGDVDENELDEITRFAKERLQLIFPEDFATYDHMERIDYLFERLNRPIRVCGMVKNEGEPGGGPFLVEQENGQLSYQIIESSQLDRSKADQMEIFRKATHFNPVDLVCGVRDFRGNKFDLNKFVDENTGFISIKSKDGRELKALELPGLWNGAMADWITVFAEVPTITFNPVKTVNDLLRPEHQA